MTPLDLGPDALRRIIEERLLNRDHQFELDAPLTITQFALDGDLYSIQRLVHPHNPTLRDHSRGLGLGSFLTNPGRINMKASRFAPIKAAKSFMNDPVDPLYLATHLWAKTFATMASDGRQRPFSLRFAPDEIAEQLREQHGTVRAADVRRALDLLSDARLAFRHTDGRWTVAWEEIPQARRQALQMVLAERAIRQPKRGAIDRLSKESLQISPTTQKTLFDQ